MTLRRLLGVLAVAGLFGACNNGNDGLDFLGFSLVPIAGAPRTFVVDFEPDGPAEVFIDGASVGTRDDREPSTATVTFDSRGEHQAFAVRAGIVSLPFAVWVP